MSPTTKKLIGSAIVLGFILAALPVIGTTEIDSDKSHGTAIDFGYRNVKWTEMSFADGMNGYDVLDETCHIRGYDVVYAQDGNVLSVNGQSNLRNMKWGMYVLEDKKWSAVEDPCNLKASDYKILCWARVASAQDVTPAIDSTGFTYYGYASNGISKTTGEKMKVVSLAPSVTETVCAVDGLEYLIGTDNFSNYPEEIKTYRDDGTIKEIGGYSDPSYEAIVSLHPDLVICDGSVGQHIMIADKLRKSGISCAVLYNTTDVDTIFLNLWITASALGLSDNAGNEIAHIRSTIDSVAGIAGTTNTKAFVALSADPSPWTAGSQTYISDAIDLVGGTNVFASQSSSWFMVSKEQIYSKQPYAIIIISATPVKTESEYNAIIGNLDPLWKQTPAFEKDNIYIFSGKAADMMSRPGPRISEAAEFIAKIFNPIAFRDEDPSDIVPNFIGDEYSVYLRYQEATP